MGWLRISEIALYFSFMSETAASTSMYAFFGILASEISDIKEKIQRLMQVFRFTLVAKNIIL